jgi:cephalosporin hydroxylase
MIRVPDPSSPAVTRFHSAPVTVEPQWMMQLGERFAFEGLLSQLRPRIAVEIGTWEGGSLRRIAAHAGHVHAFDIDERSVPHAEALDNVTLHLGDSALEVPRVLGELHARGEEVDFALVDGLHTYDAVQADARALLAAEACRATTIVFHDSAHDEVRRGLEDLRLDEHPKVALFLPDFVPGYVVRDGEHISQEIRGRSFNGLGLLVLDPGWRPTATSHEDFEPFPALRGALAATKAST